MNMIKDNFIEVNNNFLMFNKLYNLNKVKKDKQIIFLCVGNSKIWFDSFGPIVGSVLKLMDFGFYIYGNTKTNINAKNINEYIEMIYNFHKNPYIIVFDNSLSMVEEPMLKIKEGPTICSVFNNSVSVGDLSVTYCLSKKHIKNHIYFNEMLKSIKKIIRMLIYILKN